MVFNATLNYTLIIVLTLYIQTQYMYPFKIFVQVTVYTQKLLLFKRKIIVILIIPFNIIDNTTKKLHLKLTLSIYNKQNNLTHNQHFVITF